MKLDPGMMYRPVASQYLGTTEKGVLHLVKKRGLPCRRQGRRLVFVKTELDAWMAALPTDAEYRRQLQRRGVKLGNQNLNRSGRRGRPVKPPQDLSE